MKKLLLILLFGSLSTAYATEMKTIGWIERVTIMPEKFHLQAKIDTGADNSSVDAADWQSFQKGDEEWIRFSITSNDQRRIIIEEPLLRYTSIKRKRAEPVTRPVIQMELCIAGEIVQVPVNLADRANYEYRMLIGRSALSGRFLVDSSRKNMAGDQCTQ